MCGLRSFHTKCAACDMCGWPPPQAEGGEDKLKELLAGIKGSDFLELDAGALLPLTLIHPLVVPLVRVSI